MDFSTFEQIVTSTHWRCFPPIRKMKHAEYRPYCGSLWLVGIFPVEKPPLPALNMWITPGPVYLASAVGGGGAFLPLPLSFSISDLVHCTAHLIVLIYCRWTAVFPNSFYPMKRTAVTWTAYYLVTLFSLHMHHAYLKYSPKYMSLILN